MPIEIAENTYPLRFDRYEIARDAAGPGQYRGSPALVREFQYFSSDSLVQVRSDKRDHPPFGLAGGGPGEPSMTTVDHAGEVTVRPVIGPSPILSGDRFRHQLASGAGWGDPLDRDPEAVLRDVRNGLVSPARALADYGVVIELETLDLPATTLERGRRRARPDATSG